MVKKILNWKKVFEHDLGYICEELKEVLPEKSCIIFTGEVGAGKTTFIQNFMNENQGEKEVLSPTYSIINEMGDLAHADFYRIEDPEEIIHLEMGLYAEGKKYFLIEWGMPFVKEIRSQISEHFKFFELKIEINESSSGQIPSRNIDVFELI